MEFACARCGGVVQNGQCTACAAVYFTRCPRCGNTLEFVQVEVADETMLRCQVCQNDSDLQMQVLDVL